MSSLLLILLVTLCVSPGNSNAKQTVDQAMVLYYTKSKQIVLKHINFFLLFCIFTFHLYYYIPAFSVTVENGAIGKRSPEDT